MEEIMAAWSSEQGGGDDGGLFLPPGFRFHPTDEEIIISYLLRKFLNPSFANCAVGEVDLNSCEPRDLPGKAKMEEEWYFFVHKDLKYPTGSRANRATREGYWKATGKDREIIFKSSGELVGMKKTLVFYTGRAPRGAKSDWVMHEFRLEGKYRDKNMNDPKDEWVVCKVFNKKKDAKTTTKIETAAAAAAASADVEGSYSAVTTPNASSVEVEGEEGTGDFIDSIFSTDPLYFTNSDEYTGNQMPTTKETTTVTTNTNTNTNADAPPYIADFYYTVPPTAGTFNAMPNYSLTNAPSNMQAVTADTMASSVQAITGDSDLGYSWQQQHMLNTPPHEMGRKRSYDSNLREQQAIMMVALEGVIGSTNFGAPETDLPPPQKMMKLGSYDVVDGEFPYGNYAAATMNGQPSAAQNFGAWPY